MGFEYEFYWGTQQLKQQQSLVYFVIFCVYV